MILIKKPVILISSIIMILFIAIIAYFIQSDSNKDTSTTETLKKVEEKESTNEDETGVEEEEVDEDKDTNETGFEDVMTKEDPLKDFLSDKVNKAIQRIFKRDLYVVSIGDSLTEGVGDDEQNGGYVGILEDTINQEEQLVTIDNFGKRGNRSDQLLQRLKEEKDMNRAIEKADIIFITIGANDIMQVFKDNFTDLTLDKFTSEQIRYEQRIDTIFTTLRDTNEDATIYLIGFYNPFIEYFPDIEELEYIVDSWNQIGSDVASEYDYSYYIPMKDVFEGSTEELLSDDNFHPNHVGYQLMAERILNYMTNEGELNEPTSKRKK